MNSIDRLSEIFSKFPGIGPRQAKRFVYFLLSRPPASTDELVRAIENLKREIVQCSDCMRYFAKNGNTTNLCSTCSDTSRDSSMLMIVPQDIDFEAVDKSGGFRGYYFVLGGSVPILEKEPEKRIRLRELKKIFNKRKEQGLEEVVLAMNANAEGENTAFLIKDMFRGEPFTFSVLGRGLSTGAELEYADPDTLKSAFEHRTK